MTTLESLQIRFPRLFGSGTMSSHTHQSFDYRVRGCRVMCNPRGYVNWSGRTENQNFDPGLVLQVPDCKHASNSLRRRRLRWTD